MKKVKQILVTGAGGQLGMCFQKQAKDFGGFRFLFTGSSELNITSAEAVTTFFEQNQVDYCINCAAYTQVDQAETETKKAFLVNAETVRHLAETCKRHQSVLVHFSTDYVFDGKQNEPYSEEDQPHPLNVYGASKLKGETYIREKMERYFIFRTSWLYSEFGRNFYKTILRKSEEKDVELKITTGERGTPTNANNMARAVLHLLAEENTHFGLYHYSNLGDGTWYDFAKEILKNAGKLNRVKLTAVPEYKTKAKRPPYSVLSKYKTTTRLKWAIPFWKESLQNLQSGN